MARSGHLNTRFRLLATPKAASRALWVVKMFFFKSLRRNFGNAAYDLSATGMINSPIASKALVDPPLAITLVFDDRVVFRI